MFFVFPRNIKPITTNPIRMCDWKYMNSLPSTGYAYWPPQTQFHFHLWQIAAPKSQYLSVPAFVKPLIISSYYPFSFPHSCWWIPKKTSNVAAGIHDWNCSHLVLYSYFPASAFTCREQRCGFLIVWNQKMLLDHNVLYHTDTCLIKKKKSKYIYLAINDNFVFYL